MTSLGAEGLFFGLWTRVSAVKGIWISFFNENYNEEKKMDDYMDDSSVTYCWRRAGTALGVLHVCARTPGELLQQKSAFQTELHYAALHASYSDARSVIGFFDFVHSVLELDAFSSVRFFDGRGKSRRNGSYV